MVGPRTHDPESAGSNPALASAGFRGIGVIIIRVYGADMKVVFSIIRGCIRCFIFMGRFSADSYSDMYLLCSV